MARFRFVSIEKTWQDIYSNFDEDEIYDLIREMYEGGHSREYIQERVERELMNNAWADYDCGEVFDSETIDTDFDGDNDDESVYSVVNTLVSNFYYEEENNTEDREQIHLGGLEDD